MDESYLPEAEILKNKNTQTAIPEGNFFSKEKLDEMFLAIMEREHDFRWEWADMKML